LLWLAPYGCAHVGWPATTTIFIDATYPRSRPTKNEISAGTSPAGRPPEKERLKPVINIGIGRDDPRHWVKAAYLLIDAIENRETGPHDPLPIRAEIAAKLGIHQATVGRAYRELIEMGIIYWVDGHGYFPNVRGRM